MKIEVGVSRDDFSGTAKALLAALEPDEILDEASTIILNRIRTRFLAEQGPDSKWVPSKAAMIRRGGGFTWSNGRKWTGTGTLFASGRLFHSIQVVRGASDERSFLTDVPYAKYHQFGKGDMARPFLGFNKEDISVVESLIKRRVSEALS